MILFTGGNPIERGARLSIGTHRVRHGWTTKTRKHTGINWEGKVFFQDHSISMADTAWKLGPRLLTHALSTNPQHLSWFILFYGDPARDWAVSGNHKWEATSSTHTTWVFVNKLPTLVMERTYTTFQLIFLCGSKLSFSLLPKHGSLNPVSDTIPWLIHMVWSVLVINFLLKGT